MNYINFYSSGGVNVLPWLPVFGALVVVLALWTIFWKGLALWHAARHNQPWWFFAILLLNTAGILEIIFLFAVLKLKFSDLFART